MCNLQGCGSAFISSGSGSSMLGWIPIRIQGFNDQKLKKKFGWKKNIFFLWKTTYSTICLSLGLHKERPSNKPSARKRGHPTLQNMNFYFCGSFLPSWIRIRIPNPDPLTRLNPDPIRIRNPGNLSSCVFRTWCCQLPLSSRRTCSPPSPASYSSTRWRSSPSYSRMRGQFL